MMIEHRAYCWKDKNGGWQVGKPLLADGEVNSRPRHVDSDVWDFQVLMEPSHAGPPTWVWVDELEPYPLEPIDEPIVKGGE